MCTDFVAKIFSRNTTKVNWTLNKQTAFIGLKIMRSICVKKLLQRETFHKDIENERRHTV